MTTWMIGRLLGTECERGGRVTGIQGTWKASDLMDGLNGNSRNMTSLGLICGPPALRSSTKPVTTTDPKGDAFVAECPLGTSATGFTGKAVGSDLNELSMVCESQRPPRSEEVHILNGRGASQIGVGFFS